MVLAHLPYSPKAHGTQLKKEGERQSNPIEIQAEDREQGKKMERVQHLETNFLLHF